jgi:hypothetical protein
MPNALVATTTGTRSRKNSISTSRRVSALSPAW